MTWYYILFWGVLSFFIIKTIISWFFGDTDVDFDADGDIDFDLSSMFSFKGILHFLLGFSSYLSIIARFSNEYDSHTTYHFTIINYIVAIFIGFIFMILLWYLYKLVMKCDHSNSSNPNFNNSECSILTNLGNGYYLVLIKTPLGTFKKTYRHIDSNPNIPIGTEMRMIKNFETNEYLIG